MPTRTDVPSRRGRSETAVLPRSRYPRFRSGAAVWFLAFFLSQPVTAVFAASVWVGTGDVSRPVWIDDEYCGLSPVWVDALEDGAHTIAVGTRPGSLEWVRPWKARVTLSGEESVRMEVPALQTLRILSSGRPIEVALDGEPIGWTPLHLLVPRERSLELRAGVQTPLLYRAAGSSDSTLVLQGPKEMRHAPAQLGTPRSGLLLPLGAVAFGVLGAWARQEGDRAYDDYLATVDRVRMQEKYDRAERYDDLAVGFWFAAEALLVASVWKWLRGSAPDRPHAGTPVQMELRRPGELRLGVTVPIGGGATGEGDSR